MNVTVDGEPVTTDPCTVAALLISAGRDSGVFCGIGVCFGCMVSVNGEDVRGCRRVLAEGDQIRTRR